MSDEFGEIVACFPVGEPYRAYPFADDSYSEEAWGSIPEELIGC
jgi:hypothetical protein